MDTAQCPSNVRVHLFAKRSSNTHAQNSRRASQTCFETVTNRYCTYSKCHCRETVLFLVTLYVWVTVTSLIALPVTLNSDTLTSYTYIKAIC